MNICFVFHILTLTLQLTTYFKSQFQDADVRNWLYLVNSLMLLSEETRHIFIPRDQRSQLMLISLIWQVTTFYKTSFFLFRVAAFSKKKHPTFFLSFLYFLYRDRASLSRSYKWLCGAIFAISCRFGRKVALLILITELCFLYWVLLSMLSFVVIAELCCHYWDDL